MHYRRLGDAGMKVSTIGLGGWMNYGEGKVPDDEARRIVERAYELGINFFDLADEYGKGAAERHMGQILGQFPRHTLVISTKIFWPITDDINDRGLSRKHIMEGIDRSLRNLDTDYVDIYFCHRPDPETPILETARAMHTLIEQGKVLYWGTSEWSAAQLTEAVLLCEKYHLHPPKAEQPQYSMVHRQRVEQEILPITEPNGIGLVVWSPLAMGLLTGKYDDGIPADSRFHKEPWAKERYLSDTWIERVRRLKPIADEVGLSRSQLALAWLLRQPGLSSVITSATKVSQIEETAQAGDVDLSNDIIRRIEQVLTT